MCKLLSFIILIGLVFFGHDASGQHSEYCAQSGGQAKFKNPVALSDSSFVAILDYIDSNERNVTYLQAFDNSGHELWNTKDSSSHCLYYRHLRKSSSGMPVAYGYKKKCSTDKDGFLHFFDKQGNLFAATALPVLSEGHQIWGSARFTTMPWGYALVLMAKDPFHASFRIVYGLDEAGQLLWEVKIPEDSYLSIASLDEKVALSTWESIVLIENDGEVVTDIIRPGEPKAATLYSLPGVGMLMQTSDSLFVYSSQLIPMASVAFEQQWLTLHVSDSGQVLVLTDDELRTYDSALELLEVRAMESPPINFWASFIELGQNIVMVGSLYSKQYYNAYAGHHLSEAWYYYDFDAGPNTIYPDIGVTKIELFNFQPGQVYSFSAGATVEIENFGNVSIDGFWLNHLSAPIYLPNSFVSRYFDLTLNPGESVEVTYEPFGIGSYEPPYNQNPLSEVICVFSSGPGGYIDRNWLNDDVCLDLRELFVVNPDKLKAYPNPALYSFRISGFDTPSFYRIVDLSGRTVQSGEAHPHRDIAFGSNIIPGLYIVHVDGEGSLKVFVE